MGEAWFMEVTDSSRFLLSARHYYKGRLGSHLVPYIYNMSIFRNYHDGVLAGVTLLI